jgi:protein CWC15
LRQLEAIKKEKESEKQKKIAEEQREQEKIRREEFLLGNPLLNQSDDYSLKRKWTDDTVFKNCAKGISDKVEKRFINDTIRSDFHKKFMKKYVK